MCFSPYLEGQNIGDQLSKAQISRRMDIVAPYTKWVRSFSCTEGNEHTPKIAHDKDLKTMVGAWIGSDKAQNEKELATLIKLGKSGLVDIAVVGNETLMREELTENELLDISIVLNKPCQEFLLLMWMPIISLLSVLNLLMLAMLF